MTETRPQIHPDGRYSQAAAARALQVDRHTVARWERCPEIPLESYRRKTGGKFYRGKDLIRIWESYV